MIELQELEEKTLDDLQDIAKEFSIESGKLRKRELMVEIMRRQAEKNGVIWTQGVLEILPRGTDSCG